MLEFRVSCATLLPLSQIFTWGLQLKVDFAIFYDFLDYSASVCQSNTIPFCFHNTGNKTK